MTGNPTSACTRCGAAMSPGARFCGNCGATAAATTCRYCNAALTPADRFCGVCGTPVSEEDVRATRTMPAPDLQAMRGARAAKAAAPAPGPPPPPAAPPQTPAPAPSAVAAPGAPPTASPAPVAGRKPGLVRRLVAGALTILVTATLAWGISQGQAGAQRAWAWAQSYTPQWLDDWAADTLGIGQTAETPPTDAPDAASSATESGAEPPGGATWPPAGPATSTSPGTPRLTARLDVRSEGEPLQILVNGMDVGARTPTALNLEGAPGARFTLSARDAAGEVASRVIELGLGPPAPWIIPGRGASAVAIRPDAPGAEASKQPSSRVLRVTSRPAGATVFLNSARLPGTTPLSVTIADNALHQLRLELPGHRAVGWSFSLGSLTDAQNRSGELHFPLAAEPRAGGWLRIVTPGYSATVEIAGESHQVQGTREIALPVGTHEARINAPEVFLTSRSRVQVEAGATVNLNLPAAVTVNVAASPGNCRLSVNGRFVDVTPVRLRLVPGDYSFDFNWPGLGRSMQRSERISREGQQIFVAADAAPATEAAGPTGAYEPPVKIVHVDPQYTPEARRQGIEGSVLLTLTIDDQGNVVSARVARSLGAGLDEAAMRAALQWKYQPARAGGQPLTTTLVEAIRFQLR